MKQYAVYKEVKLSWVERYLRPFVQHYDDKKYWDRREKVLTIPKNKLQKLMNYYRLYYIKRCDAFNNATFGTHMGYGAVFAERPNLPHGLFGIVVSHGAQIGKNCTILHQVTIGEGKNGAPTIRDNVYIGAGAKIIGAITIGSNVKIGVNAAVVHDVPDNSVVKAPEGVICQRG